MRKITRNNRIEPTLDVFYRTKLLQDGVFYRTKLLQDGVILHQGVPKRHALRRALHPPYNSQIYTSVFPLQIITSLHLPLRVPHMPLVPPAIRHRFRPPRHIFKTLLPQIEREEEENRDKKGERKKRNLNNIKKKEELGFRFGDKIKGSDWLHVDRRPLITVLSFSISWNYERALERLFDLSSITIRRPIFN